MAHVTRALVLCSVQMISHVAVLYALVVLSMVAPAKSAINVKDLVHTGRSNNFRFVV